MKVVKFGGTSVGTPERMHHISRLIASNEPRIVVLSAVAGTTNSLVEVANDLYGKRHESALEKIARLEKFYHEFVEKLYSSASGKEKGKQLISSHFEHIRSFTRDLFTLFEEKAVLAQGELISTALFHYYLEESGISSELLPALEFMRIDKEGEPDMYYIERNLRLELARHSGRTLFITQGYICRNVYGEIDNLKRGGSDYTASLVGAAIGADEVQIWTDIDGMHNNDPRVVKETYPIRELSFDEAAELAYFGAKILHPSSIRPAKEKNIPVRLKNTMDPEAPGTLIIAGSKGEEIKAVAAKDGITALKIKSGRMLMAYGFMRVVFEIFERYKTPIDMITTSEVAVSLTIDDITHLKEIISELNHIGVVEVDHEQTIICIVGDFLAEKHGYAARLFHALRNIPIRMISYGGSRNNVSVLVHTKHKAEALQSLNRDVFEKARVV